MADSLDLVQLRSFVAIAECGGFGRAATALHLSQPAVSQHVRLLERRLRLTLVVRDGRQTRFTPDGDRLLEEARRILAVHDEALARLAASTPAALVVGSTETAADEVLPALLAMFRDAYPDRPLRFTIDRSTQMAEAVGKGVIDVAVLLGLTADTPGRLVGTLPLRWYGRADLPVPVRGQTVSLVAYSAPCGMRARALTELSEAGFSPDVTAEATTLEGVVGAARAGLGVAVLPSAGAVPSGLVERTDLPPLGVIGVHLATRKGLDLDVEAAALTALEAFFERMVDPSALPMARHHESLLDAS